MTTVQCITWTLYFLIRHPAHLSQVLGEVRAIPPLTVNTEVESHVPFLEAAVWESLRLRPPSHRSSYENFSASAIILADGTIVQPGEVVVFSPWVAGRSAELWGPGDLEKFQPERWLPPTMQHKPTAYEFPVFSGGSKACKGQQMARMEVVVTLVELFRRYEFEMGWSGDERLPLMGLVLRMDGGLPVRVRSKSSA